MSYLASDPQGEFPVAKINHRTKFRKHSKTLRRLGRSATPLTLMDASDTAIVAVTIKQQTKLTRLNISV